MASTPISTTMQPSSFCSVRARHRHSVRRSFRRSVKAALATHHRVQSTCATTFGLASALHKFIIPTLFSQTSPGRRPQAPVAPPKGTVVRQVHARSTHERCLLPSPLLPRLPLPGCLAHRVGCLLVLNNRPDASLTAVRQTAISVVRRLGWAGRGNHAPETEEWGCSLLSSVAVQFRGCPSLSPHGVADRQPVSPPQPGELDSRGSLGRASHWKEGEMRRE
jgi:hypothetical protein